MAENRSKSGFQRYQEETNTYAYSLVLILPLILIYEAGRLMYDRDNIFGVDSVLANEFIVIIFRKLNFGNVTIIPAALVMAALFFLQMRSGKKWEINFKNVMLMHVEYGAFAAIFFFATAWLFEGSLSFHVPGMEDALISLGAGIYEEFLFRFILLGGLMYILEKGLKVERQRRIYASVIVSALVFAGFHHILGNESFRWGDFLFRTAAGVYFGILYLQRGYGTASGTHAAYNILRVIFIGSL